METGHANPTNYSTNQLDSQTSSALTKSVPWVWVCAIPFILSGAILLLASGIALIGALNAGFSAILLAGIQLIWTTIVLYLGISLIKFALSVSNFKNGNQSSLLPAFKALGGYFRVTGILILLSFALIGLTILLGVGSALALGF